MENYLSRQLLQPIYYITFHIKIPIIFLLLCKHYKSAPAGILLTLIPSRYYIILLLIVPQSTDIFGS